MIRAYLAAPLVAIVTAAVATTLCLIGVIGPSRRVKATLTAWWAHVVLAVCGARLTIVGTEYLDTSAPTFFVGNHQSGLDIPILISALNGEVRFMAKRSLFWIPLFGWALKLYGYVPIDRSHPRATLRSLDRAVERLRRRPVSLVIFPEGTRSRDGRLLPFRRGAMKICGRVGFAVVPFVIDGSFRVNPPGPLRLRPGGVRITFEPPISAERVSAMSSQELHDCVRDIITRAAGQTKEPSAAQAAIA